MIFRRIVGKHFEIRETFQDFVVFTLENQRNRSKLFRNGSHKTSLAIHNNTLWVRKSVKWIQTREWNFSNYVNDWHIFLLKKQSLNWIYDETQKQNFNCSMVRGSVQFLPKFRVCWGWGFDKLDFLAKIPNIFSNIQLLSINP